MKLIIVITYDVKLLNIAWRSADGIGVSVQVIWFVLISVTSS